MSTHHLDPTPDAAVWPTTAEEPSSEERTPRHGPSRRAVLVASAAAAVVPATGTVLVAAPALADPSVAGGETRIVDVPLADVALIDVEGGVARDLAEQPATMIGV
ncbi:MAG: hypothetical protein ACTH6N_13005, partial [Brachybacterium tyrofermentans]